MCLTSAQFSFGLPDRKDFSQEVNFASHLESLSSKMAMHAYSIALWFASKRKRYSVSIDSMLESVRLSVDRNFIQKRLFQLQNC